MRYRAFFSYSRADDRIANWLHGQLDSYRTPKGLVGTQGALGRIPAKLHPIFRDRTDLASGAHLDADLQAALENSETLVVLCSPDAAKSTWVNHEIETFIRLGRKDRIFPVIARGEPNSGDPGTECFPPALRPQGILAADLRQFKTTTGQLVGDGREAARLKLIAGLLGLPLDELAKRERRRQRQVSAALGGAAILFAAVAAVAIWQAHEADNERVATRNVIHRSYAARAWDKFRDGDLNGATRYALAGYRLSPSNAEEFRTVLSVIVQLSGNSAPPLSHGHGAIENLTFSPDGTKFLTSLYGGVGMADGPKDYTVKIWNTDRQKPISTLIGHAAGVTGATFSPDGLWVATSSHDKSAKIWDPVSGTLVRSIVHPEAVISVDFSKDSKSIITTSKDGIVRAWEVTTGVLLYSMNPKFGVRADSATSALDGGRYSSDGQIIFLDGFKQTVALEAKTKKFLYGLGPAAGYHPGAYAVELPDTPRTTLSHDGTKVLVADGRGEVGQILSARDGHLLASMDGAARAAFSNDDRLVIANNVNFELRLFDAASGKAIFRLDGSGFVSEGAFSPDGKTIVTGDLSGRATIWDTGTGRSVAVLPSHDAAPLTRARFSPDGHWIVTTDRAGEIRFWPARGDAIPLEGADPANRQYVYAPIVGFSPSGRSIVRPSRTNGTQVFSADDGGLVRTFPGSSVSAQFSPDGKRIASTGGDEGSVTIWDAASGSQLARFTGFKFAGVLAYSPDGRTIILANGRDGPTWIIDPQTGRMILTLDTGPGVRAVSFSPDGREIVTANPSIDIWDARSGKRRLSLFPGSPQGRGAPSSVAYSPNGKVIAAGNSLWDVKSGQLIISLPAGEGIYSFSPDGTRIASSREPGGDIKIWSALDGHLLTSFNASGPGIFSPTGNTIASSQLLIDTHHVVSNWDQLQSQACIHILGQRGRKFDQHSINEDPLLASEWPPDRDVCEGVVGAPPIPDRRNGGLVPKM